MSHERNRQRGATAVEFAFVFPILFLLVYGVIVYSYVYVLQQSITYTAQFLAEAAVAVNPNPQATHEARVTQQVQQLASRQLNWLPAGQRARVIGTNGELVEPTYAVIDGSDVVTVQLTFALEGLFPTLRLPLVGEVPPLPEQLRVRATARI